MGGQDMQISGVGIMLAAATGMLAVWLYLGADERAHDTHRVAMAEMRCDNARFDASFPGAGREQQARAERLCREAEQLRAEIEARAAKIQSERASMRDQIPRLFGFGFDGKGE